MPKGTYSNFLKNDPDEPNKGKRTGPSARLRHGSDSVKICSSCKGKGKVDGKICPACRGDSGVDLKNI